MLVLNAFKLLNKLLGYYFLIPFLYCTKLNCFYYNCESIRLILSVHKFSFLMVVYFNAELTDIYFMYGRANGIATEARCLYNKAYPNR